MFQRIAQSFRERVFLMAFHKGSTRFQGPSYGPSYGILLAVFQRVSGKRHPGGGPVPLRGSSRPSARAPFQMPSSAFKPKFYKPASKSEESQSIYSKKSRWSANEQTTAKCRISAAMPKPCANHIFFIEKGTKN